MAQPIFTAQHFQNEDAAFAYVEGADLAAWPGLPPLQRH